MEKHSGFTLLELLVTVAIIAIVAQMALPAFATSSKNRQAEKLFNELQIDLLFARNQALTLGQEVTVKPTAGGWSEGRIIEQNGVIIRQRGSASKPLATGNELSSSYTAGAPLLFDHRGRTPNPNQHAVNGDFHITVVGCKGNKNKRLLLNYIGQITTTDVPCL